MTAPSSRWRGCPIQHRRKLPVSKEVVGLLTLGRQYGGFLSVTRLCVIGTQETWSAVSDPAQRVSGRWFSHLVEFARR